MKSGKSCVKHSKAAVRAALLSGIAALAIQIPPASAADYGVGVLHNGTGSTVLFPIRTESLNVEPEINFSKATGDQPTHSLSIATGVYLRKQLGSSFESSVGARLGYRERKIQLSSTLESDSHSWFLTPTAGIQYFFTKQISIGFDVGLEYARVTSKTTDSTFFPNLNTNSSGHSWDTVTRIMLRAYF
jgi:hypothetical protein